MEKTQAQRFGEKLIEIKVNVTAEDRNKAKDKFGYVDSTMWKYLNGNGEDVAIAANLLEFFVRRIKGREKLLNS